MALLLMLLWWAPWWLFLSTLVLTVLFLPHFYQALLPALLFDLINVAPGATWYHSALPVTIATLIWLWIAARLQRYLRL